MNMTIRIAITEYISDFELQNKLADEMEKTYEKLQKDNNIIVPIGQSFELRNVDEESCYDKVIPFLTKFTKEFPTYTFKIYILPYNGDEEIDIITITNETIMNKKSYSVFDNIVKFGNDFSFIPHFIPQYVSIPNEITRWINCEVSDDYDYVKKN
jgi:hypothetical protein